MKKSSSVAVLALGLVVVHCGGDPDDGRLGSDGSGGVTVGGAGTGGQATGGEPSKSGGSGPDGSGGATGCTPGISRDCEGLNGCDGTQKCDSDGRGWTVCGCSSALGGAGGDDTGTGGREASGGVSASDGGTSSGGAPTGGGGQVGGGGECNLFTQDCGEDLACVPGASASICVTPVEDPAQQFEECEEPGDCGLGLFCPTREWGRTCAKLCDTTRTDRPCRELGACLPVGMDPVMGFPDATVGYCSQCNHPACTSLAPGGCENDEDCEQVSEVSGYSFRCDKAATLCVVVP